jgi:hypothetical protein
VSGLPAGSSPSRLDRFLGAYPLIAAYLALLVLYAWQTTKISTPWLFTDELQWAELSRGVAHHGVPQLRLHDESFSSLYAYLIAPAWWASTTPGGYAAAKYIDAAVMTAALFPGYALARLFVPRVPAIFCGIATAAIPSFVYVGLLIPEPFAYFWSTLALWLGARALLRPTRVSVAWAAAALLIAPEVRGELVVLLFAAFAAAAIVLATGARGRRLVGSWTWIERGGALLLLAGGAIAVGAIADHHSYSWQVGTHYHHRMFTYGLWAVGAYTLGVGIVPVVLALTWLLGNRFRALEDRVLGASLIGAVLAFGTYTAVKASYISTQFAIRVEERNFIYVAPVMFVVVARWAYAGRTRLVPLALAAGAVWYLLDTTPFHNTEHFYSDAPGLSVLQWLNQKAYFSTTDARRLVFSILAGAVVIALARTYGPRKAQLVRLAVPAGALLAAAIVGWNLWGEIAAANASSVQAKSQRSQLVTPPNWIDDETGKARTMFIGQSLAGSNLFWSLEFWNQSIQDVWSVDATAPGPGPVITPDFASTRGVVEPQLPIHWVVAAPGVDPAGTLAEPPAGGLRLFHVTAPIRLADAYGGLSTDGANWMTTSSFYYHFAPRGPTPGVASVSLSRAAACGSAPPSHMTVTLSALRIDPSNRQPVAGRTLAVKRLVLRSTPCETRTITFHTHTPFRIDVVANGTFQASPSDPRQLSAQVDFGWAPSS